ncbi:MAG: DUF3276 family protein [Bacteroidales bacterium]|jgi:hypothetical protein|nr:PUR family DNA/RNA-binding protein [Bacteroidales bacterium]
MKREKEEVYSKSVKAGRRTYFFDVKESNSGDRYITITESRKELDESTGQFGYKKTKIFLYKEDMDKFARGLRYAIEFIETGIDPEEGKEEILENRKFDKENLNKFSDNHDDEDIIF